MSTQYTHNAVAVCPEALFVGGNSLIACFGEGQAHDLDTFRSASLTDGVYDYAVCAPPIKQSLYDTIAYAALNGLTLTRPEWDVGELVDLEAAQDVLDDAVIIEGFDPENLPEWDGSIMLIVLDADWRVVAGAFQLGSVVEPE